MAKLSDLKLDEGAAPQIDWDAPEAGQTPPPVYPGIYTLRFKMVENPDDWFDSNEVEMIKNNPASKRKFLVVNYLPDIMTSHATRDSAGVPVPVDPTTNQPLHLGPQRASFYKSDKMMISEGGELLRALGVRLEGNMLAQIESTLQQLNGRVSFMAEIGWKAYFRNTDSTVTTHPRKKKGDLAWPRDAAGKPEMLATNPATGEKAYGYAVVVKIIPPHTS